jgi:ubiquitin conjugation factor E4 B
MQQEYKFDPKGLLSDIMTVYCNLSAKPNFISAIARDARSYKPANFERAAAIMKKNVLKSPEQMRTWTDLAAAVAEAKAAEDEEEQDLGDIPTEFEDQIMGILMRDPVTLPSSRQVVDRSTVRSHLLSDPTDPFNRVPLKIEEVLPNDELKERIEAWIGERKAAKAAQRSGPVGEGMDTSEG